MKNKIIVVAILLSSLFVLSCKDDETFTLSVTPEKTAASYDGLLMVAHGKNIYGFAPDSLAVEVELKLNTFISRPVVDSDGTMYVGDQGTEIGSYGNYLFSFNKDGSLKNQISAIPNISNIVCTNSFVFMDSNCFYGDAYCMGYAIVDKATETRTQLNTDLTYYLTHSGSQWIYNNKIYVGTAYRSGKGNTNVYPISFFTINATTGEKSDAMSDFTVASGNQEKFFYTLDGGTLITLYGNQYVFRKYNLDTNELVATLSVASDVPALQTGLNSMTAEDVSSGLYRYQITSPVVCGRKLYAFCVNTAYSKNAGCPSFQCIIVIDLDTFTFEKYVSLARTGEYDLASPFYTADAEPNSVYFIHENNFEKYSLADGTCTASTAVSVD